MVWSSPCERTTSRRRSGSCGPRWRRPPPVWASTLPTRRRGPAAGAYLQSPLGTVERKNSWQLAEAAGLETPYRFQHLLGRGAWDADALRDEQLGVVLAGLGQEDAVLAIEETGFIKAGQKERGRQTSVPRHFRQDRQLPDRRVPVLADAQGPCAHRPRALPGPRSGPTTKNDGRRQAYPKPWSFPPSPPWRARGLLACWPPGHVRRGWWPTPCTEPTTSCGPPWRKPGSPTSWRSPANGASGWAWASGA